MEKVDVSIQSYKKPESLIYSLLSLKKSLKSDEGGGNIENQNFCNQSSSLGIYKKP